jgi:two-component system LytT family response regulator
MTIKAMIIDDEPFAREDLRHVLERHPEVEVKWEASRMDEAKRLLATHCPDVVFLDIELRGGSGLDLVSEIDQNMTKIIFVTGHDANTEKARQTGAIGCICKPVGLGTLSGCLEKLRGLGKESGER